jgi:hypothetical protein
MTAIEYSYEDNLIRLDDGIVEQFKRIVSGSHRTPMQWVAVDLLPRKHDLIRVQVGFTMDAAAGVISKTYDYNGPFVFDIPPAEEPRLRGFFNAVAQAANRPI